VKHSEPNPIDFQDTQLDKMCHVFSSVSNETVPGCDTKEVWRQWNDDCVRDMETINCDKENGGIWKEVKHFYDQM
jgi:hypothetical protein